MSQTAAAALTITPEAAAYVRDLGMQEQFAQMLEHARQIIPGRQAFAVSLLSRYDHGDGFGVIIDATSDDSEVKERPFDREWARWQIETFPPQVWEHFNLYIAFVPYAR